MGTTWELNFLGDPLYRRWECKGQDREWPETINSFCDRCKSWTTFVLEGGDRRLEALKSGTQLDDLNRHSYCPKIEYGARKLGEHVVSIRYQCRSCNKQERYYIIHWDEAFIEKIGQYPPYSIRVDKELADALGDNKENYRMGLICISQSYGLGACAYLRRVVENTMDSILRKMKELLPEAPGSDEQLAEIEKALRSTQGVQKAQLAAAICPDSLRPGGRNPFKILHEELSRSIHGLSEEECLGQAILLRTVLEGLITGLNSAAAQDTAYKAAIAKAAEAKAKRGTQGTGEK